jgi:endo-1,4-beta-xylanase
MKNKNLIKYVLLLLISFFAIISCSKDDKGVEPLGTAYALSSVSPTMTGFTAKWARIYRAESYLLDVSEQQNFSTVLPNYNAKPVTSTSIVISDLFEGVAYYYRVRAVLGKEVTAYSNVIKAETAGSLIEPTTALKVKATTFKVGVAVSSGKLTGMYDTTIKKEFNSITAENEMKMREIFTSPGVYNYAKLDLLLAYAQTNSLNVHGHTLIWHGSIPDWMNTYTGTNAQFETIVHDYITAVVTHCAGKVNSWDVVNEAVDEDGTARNSIFRQKIGTDYVTKCFQWARAADANAKLFYNDYNTSFKIAKQNGVYALVDLLKTSNVIDGVGIQMHVNYDFPTKAQIATDTQKIVQRNLLVHYSEVDVRANSNDNALITTLTSERNAAQKLKYKEIVQVFNAIPNVNKYAITMWGLKDDDSWIIQLYNRNDWPLLFDSNFTVKKAHTGFLEGLD